MAVMSGTVVQKTDIARLETLIGGGKFAEALALCGEFLARTPENPVYWNARGLALRGLGRPAEAVPCLWKSIALDPKAAASWTNLGNALKDLRQHGQAIVALERAVRLAPRNALLHHNLGLALVRDRQFDAAIAAFDRALALDKARSAVRWDRALACLYRGDYQRGWADYETRLSNGQMVPRQIAAAPWDGKEFPGKTLLVLSEQGFGDAIWVARFLPQLRELGGRVILEARPELVPLFESNGLADVVIPKGAALPPADLYVHQCSLPRLFVPTLEAVAGKPYLTSDPKRVAPLAALFGAQPATLKVGIVWSGSATFKGNIERAQPLRRFLDAFRLPGVQLYALQLGPQAQELAAARPEAMIDLAPHLCDFADTAALLQHLDLVIMTDSAVAHLAGALGRPVWVLLNHVPHFVWSEANDQAPWYQSVRLFRPAAWDDWSGVYDRAAAALADVVFNGASL